MTVLRFTIPLVRSFGRRGSNRPRDAESAAPSQTGVPDPIDTHELDELPRMADDAESTASVKNSQYRYMPLLTGIIIPFSILLEIPGLTEHWYIRTEGNQVVETKSNPPILDAGLAISMASAVLANICLLMRFMEKGSVKLMTLLCIIFLTIHDIINITAVTIFGVEHRIDDGFTYGQAFWTTVCSTIISVITNVMLIVDYVRTPNFGKNGSGLTQKQRSLIILVMVFFIYVALCALVNTFILDRPFLDAMYYTIVSVETIGFGDVTPQTPGARTWTCAFALGGIVLLGTAVGNISDAVFEALEYAYHLRVVKLRRNRQETRKARKGRARRRNLGQLADQHDRPAALNDETGNNHLSAPATEEADDIPSFDPADFHSSLEDEKKRQFVTKLTGVWIIFVSFWLIGSAIFMATEGFTYATAMYFCFMTFSTIGFGDVTVRTQAGRAVFIFWALLGVGTMTIFVSVIVDAFSSRYKCAINLHAFEDAVKLYRRVRASQMHQRRQKRNAQPHFDELISEKTGQVHQGENGSHAQQLQRGNHGLEALPSEILSCARTLEERIRFFRSPKKKDDTNPSEKQTDSTQVPHSLVQLLNDVSDMRNLPQRVRNEALHDGDSRQVLFMLSVEDALHDMIDAAERSLAILQEKHDVVQTAASTSQLEK